MKHPNSPHPTRRMSQRVRDHRRAPNPVFVDRSGRRRRIVITAGAGAGVLVVVALGLLVAGLFGASPVPLPGLPELGNPAPTQQAPAPSAPPAPPPVPRTSTAPPAVTPQPSTTLSTTAEPTSPRHVPTHTPTDKGKPPKP